VVEFNPFVTGEPLASPFFREAIEYVSQALPDASVQVYTNGYLLDGSAADVLLGGGVDEVHFSIDGASKEVYEAHRRGLAYERVLENATDFLSRLRASTAAVRTRVVFTQTRENEHEIPAFRRMWQGLVDTVDVLPCDGRGGDGRTPAAPGAEMMGCFHVAYRTYVLTDGSVVACCKDWAPYTVLGNVAETPLADIWHSADYVRLRDDVAGGILDGSEACRRCVAGDL
jgi:MoaA/NifB/PqqE/SkfB family radical SAM enzyme